MEKPNIFKTYFSMWKRITDFTGIGTSGEYWLTLIIQFILLVIDTVCMYAFAKSDYSSLSVGIPGIIILVYLLASILPWAALCARTVNGYQGRTWIKFILFFIGIGAVIFNIILFLGLFHPAVTDFVPGLNRPQCVYGPPISIESEIDEDDPVYDPSSNIPEDIYGPPAGDLDEPEIEEFEVESNLPELVYGPPEMDSQEAVKE